MLTEEEYEKRMEDLRIGFLNAVKNYMFQFRPTMFMLIAVNDEASDQIAIIADDHSTYIEKLGILEQAKMTLTHVRLKTHAEMGEAKMTIKKNHETDLSKQ